MKNLRLISRILVGVVFIFSGFVKGVDPMGSMYKFMDYFTAFGMKQLEPAALPLAVLLIAFEFLLGVALVSNFKMKITSWITLIFMGLFTILTFYLALENPVQDCGCFGDAIILTNWETFWKNLIIMVFVVIVFIYRNKFQNTLKLIQEYSIMGIALAGILALNYYSYNHLPVIDFRPYNIGANIPEKMKIPEDAPQPEYKTILKYKKDGKIKEFELDNLPDSTWQWVETENILVEEGYQPPIHDFTITTLDGADITDIILEKKHPVFLLIAYDLKKASTKRSDIIQINDIARFANKQHDNSFICLTASLEDAIKDFKKKSLAPYKFYNTDEITLKTIIRSNPGLMVIKDGTVFNKWHYNDLPTVKEVKKKYY
jgi:uncharacterized membrane protein YphA (DoxX/SURF4 family)